MEDRGRRLADQIKSLDWQSRQAESKGKATPAEIAEIKAKIKSLLRLDSWSMRLGNAAWTGKLTVYWAADLPPRGNLARAADRGMGVLTRHSVYSCNLTMP